jgi:hypothetical protein
MNSGNTNLCVVVSVKGKYSVTWNQYLTGLSVYDEKAHILLDMILKDSTSCEVGIHLSNGYVLWLSSALLMTLDTSLLAYYVQRTGQVERADQITGAVFDNMEDVETFTKRLEQKYIWHLLKK